MSSEKLKKGISELSLTIPESTQQILLDFLAFLQKWNQTHNLTAIADIEKMVTHHLLDSLSIVPYLKGKTILDVGSGAGFPGIPIALACPEKQITLLDSKTKKTAFLLQAASRFKITNVTVVQARVEAYQPESCFDAITCRAVGGLEKIIHQTQRLLCSQGRWFIMKGTYPGEELKTVSQHMTLHVLKVPGLKAERHLVEIENSKG